MRISSTSNIQCQHVFFPCRNHDEGFRNFRQPSRSMALVLAPRHVPIVIRHLAAGPLELMCLVLFWRMTFLWWVVATRQEMGPCPFAFFIWLWEIVGNSSILVYMYCFCGQQSANTGDSWDGFATKMRGVIALRCILDVHFMLHSEAGASACFLFFEHIQATFTFLKSK